MKILNNYSTALKVVLAACLVSLAFTGTASASPQSPKHNAPYYKTQAKKHLKKYKTTANYKYYNNYLHSMKRYRACFNTDLTLQTCERLGIYATRYQKAYEKYGYKIYKRYAKLYKKRQHRCQTIVNKEGSIVGKVILDNGGNGNNRPLANVEVNIVDAKGKITTVHSNKRGYYFARHIARGDANVTIVNPQYQNKTLIQSIGANPSVVTIRPFRRAWAKRDGYTYVAKLTLSSEESSLNKGTSTTLQVVATYSNGTVKEDVNVSYASTPINIAQANNQTLTALSDGDANLTAHIDEITSNLLALNVYWEVNGHRLPPEPDETLNNSTLLGIDSNGNGVRDDVERWIYEVYKDDTYSKEKIAIAMQYGWAYQKIIETPTKESMKYQDDAIDCEEYWLGKKSKKLGLNEFLKWELSNEIMTSNFNSLIYNTKERARQYFEYNGALSGNIFPGRVRSVDNCQINIDTLGGK